MPSLFSSFRSLNKSARPPLLNITGNLGRLALRGTKLFCLWHVFVEYIGWSYPTLGPSMLPTLTAQGDFVWISRYYRRGRRIAVGDIVEFKHPYVPDTGAIKRVVGMPGDFVMRDSQESGSKFMLQVCYYNEIRGKITVLTWS